MCQGVYLLVGDERPNGFPLWKQDGGQRWLYSCKKGRWCIGGKDVRAKEFASSSGWIYNAKLHEGDTPDRVGDDWRLWDGEKFQQDVSISVSRGTEGAPSSTYSWSESSSSRNMVGLTKNSFIL